MSATVRNKFVISTTGKQSNGLLIFMYLMSCIGFFEDVLSFKANSGASLVLRNVSFRSSILASSSLKPTFLKTCLHSLD